MFLIRKVKQQDSETIRKWRNDSVTRKNAFTQRIISRKEHEAWFKKVINDKKAALLLVEEDKVPAAFLRLNTLDKDSALLTQDDKTKYSPGEIAEIHINVNPLSRGRGIGTKALKLASKYAFTLEIKKLMAQIKPENKASVKAFSNAGFKQVSENPSRIIMESINIIKLGKNNFSIGTALEPNNIPIKYKHNDIKNIGFIAYADHTIGTGHILRCITLAKEISNNKEFSCKIHFFANALGAKIKEAGFEFHNMPIPILNELNAKKINGEYNLDCIIVDIPETKSMRLLAKKLTLAMLETKIIFIDYGYENQQAGAINKIIETPIISTQFEKMKYIVRKEINTILLTFGGSDPTNATLKILQFLETANAKIIIVIGALYPYEKELTKYIRQAIRGNKIKQQNMVLMKNINNMPEVMAKADLAFSSPGATAYELCATGVPTLLLAQNEKQLIAAQNLDCAGAVINLGSARQITKEKIISALKSLNYKERKRISNIAKKTGKGLNQSKIIVDKIINALHNQIQ